MQYFSLPCVGKQAACVHPAAYTLYCQTGLSNPLSPKLFRF